MRDVSRKCVRVDGFMKRLTKDVRMREKGPSQSHTRDSNRIGRWESYRYDFMSLRQLIKFRTFKIQ